MSTNRYLPHIHVLPEDDANRQIANGFHLGLEAGLQQRQFYVLEEAGGWSQVLDRFCSVYAAEMEKTPTRFMVLLIDFDNKADRLELAKDRIPNHLRDRVFVLGALSEPEDLKSDLGSFETIGLAIARDCCENTTATWSHKLLRHKAAEMVRLSSQVRPILFDDMNCGKPAGRARLTPPAL